LRELVRIAAGEVAANALSLERIAGADWVAQSLAGLKPVRAGRFVIHGAHDRARSKPNDIDIEIEAALAFGTGHHGTTQGCLLALTHLAKRRRFLRVLDIGAGTGVLAIAAARLMHTHVVAGDIDVIAVRAAKSNAGINRAAPMIMFARAAGTGAPVIASAAPYDLIFANILLAPLTRLAVPLRKLMARGALIVLSGLLPAHANAALAIYRAQGLILERRIQREGWATLVLRRAAKQNRPGRGSPGRLRW
jgi:ribosomal protein L11 methyltransferase